MVAMLSVGLTSGTTSTNIVDSSVITPSIPRRHSNFSGLNGTYKLPMMEVRKFGIMQERRNAKGSSIHISLEAPTKDQVAKLYDEVNGFSLASHFYWGLWAMIQAMVSDIDFDYMEYAVLRFDEYDKRKEQVLASLSI
jgi:hypothetical protein